MIQQPPHALEPGELAGVFGTDPKEGLSADDARARLVRYGPNRSRRPSRPPYGRLLLHQLTDPLVALLAAAAAVSIAIGDTIEGAAIAAILALNGVLGFWQELAAERAILALAEEFTQTAVVVRDGAERELAADEVVPGDVLVVAEGDRIAADARLLDERGLEVDESSLTGESLPVAKQAAPVPPSTVLAERTPMIYAGSGVTRGHGRALVCATGAGTELRKIEALASGARPPATPLEQRLGHLARQMAVAGVLLTIALAGVMALRGEALHSAFLVGVAVAVAAVPEGLAATVTAALALGGREMARRGAIVRQLDAIETLGETTVVCTDKTGTLTENQIRVAALYPAAGFEDRDLLEAAVLASAGHEAGTRVGDPVEAALLVAALDRGLSREELLEERMPVFEIPFDSIRKRMAVVYVEDGGRRVFVKGAPEVLAEHGQYDDALLERADAWASEGLRVLAVATRRLEEDALLDETAEEGAELVGVVALHDPLRPAAAASVEEARGAGVEVRMVTGDHPATARTIGHALGLDEGAVIARAAPEDKLRLVEELQEHGEIVAVTGDGVNDAPALRRADVGIAMGRSGTEAAREAAAIVLTDDDIATIITAIREGRRIGDNIRKFVAFLLSANLGEVLVFAVAVGAGLGIPLAVIQVLIVNLVTDGLPALALGRDPADPLTMTSPPRRHMRLFDRRSWLALGLIGIVVGGVTLAAFGAGLAFGGGRSQTMAFATLALSELALAFGIRSPTVAAHRLPENRWLVWSVAGSALLVVAAVYVPALHEPLATVSLPVWPALVVAVLSTLPLLCVEAAKWLRRKTGHGGPGSLAESEPLRREAPSARFRRSSGRSGTDHRRRAAPG